MQVKQILQSGKKLLKPITLLTIICWPIILNYIFPEYLSKRLPSLIDILPGIGAFYILEKIRCPYSRLLGYFWLLWYFVGAVNTVASGIVLGEYYGNFDLHEASQIYFWGCVFYFFGMLVYEKLFSKNKYEIYSSETPSLDISFICRLFLLVFPFAWLASMYVSLGYIPILRGENITDEIYQLKYGVLYPYGALIVISIVYSVYKVMVAQSMKDKVLYLIFAVCFILMSTADGKRAFSMAAVGATIALSFKVNKAKTWTSTIPKVFYLVIVLYVGIQLIRSGDSTAGISDFYFKMTLIGVEFRDFVYTVNYYIPGEIPNYAWATSAVASVVNGAILKVFDLDKTSLVNLDSANAWAALRGSDFGIRTGIVSELWFAYGVFAMPVLFVSGLVTGSLVKRIRTTKSVMGLIFLTGIYGLLLLNVTGQSTFTFGVLPVFLYFYTAMFIMNYLVKSKRITYS